MKTPIRIHPSDTDEAAKDRHRRIEKRLEELGHDQVQAMLNRGGLPTNWDPIIVAWLKGDKLEDEEKKPEQAAPKPGEA